MPLFINSLDDIPLFQKVCLYGLGEGCYHFLRQIEKHRPDIAIVSLIDDSKTVSSTPFKVTRPECLEKGKFDIILVTSAYWVAICKRLDSLSLGNYMVVNPYLLYEHMIMTDAESAAWHDSFNRTSELLGSSEQQALYQLVVGSRSIQPDMQQDLYDYYQARQNPKTEYLEFINLSHFTTVIEGGVFDGANTAVFAVEARGSGCIYGFEPNLGDAAQSRLLSIPADAAVIKLYSLALWSHRAVLSFYKNSQNLAGARIVLESSDLQELIEVPAISIDEFVTENMVQKVDYIKLDVEGAELDVINGAVNTLQRDRPQLAICIYHKKEHLFSIPLYLDSILTGYHYYIGHYSPTFWDTVWYAVPKELARDSILK